MEVCMLNSKEFDLWADGYDKAVGISDEENTYPFAGYKKCLDLFSGRSWKPQMPLYWISDSEQAH